MIQLSLDNTNFILVPWTVFKLFLKYMIWKIHRSNSFLFPLRFKLWQFDCILGTTFFLAIFELQYLGCNYSNRFIIIWLRYHSNLVDIFIYFIIIWVGGLGFLWLLQFFSFNCAHCRPSYILILNEIELDTLNCILHIFRGY